MSKILINNNIILIYFYLKNNSKKSYEDIDSWLKDLKINSNPDIKIFLIGNKCDLEKERIIKTEDAEKLKNDFNLDLFLETSAKTGINAQKLFIEAAKILYQDYLEYKNNKPTVTSDSINLNNMNDKKSTKKHRGCCNSNNKKQ